MGYVTTHGRRRRSAVRWHRLAAAAVVALALATVAGPAGDSMASTVRGVGAPDEVPLGGANGSIGVTPRDVDSMNRVYRSETTEFVYCGRVLEGRLSVSPAEMVDRGQDYARFDATECRGMGAGAAANVHTHPSGAPTLSSTDRQLLRSGDYRYVCVQHDTIDDGEGLACYEADDDGGVQRVDVEAVDEEPPAVDGTAG